MTIPVIPALGKPKQVDLSLKPAEVTYWDAVKTLIKKK